MKSKILMIVSVILVVAFSLGLILFFTEGGFADLTKERNESNLIKVDTGYVKTLNTNRGVKVLVNENGVIKLSGKATSDCNIQIASVKLPAGTYTISGLDEPDINECWLYVQHSNGQAIAGTEGATFTLSGEETVKVYLSWTNDYHFNIFNANKVYPVIVEGNEPGSFYAE